MLSVCSKNACHCLCKNANTFIFLLLMQSFLRLCCLCKKAYTFAVMQACYTTIAVYSRMLAHLELDC